MLSQALSCLANGSCDGVGPPEAQRGADGAVECGCRGAVWWLGAHSACAVAYVVVLLAAMDRLADLSEDSAVADAANPASIACVGAPGLAQ